VSWLKKDDRFPEHRKIRRLTDGQYRLHDTALHACAKDETDGLVTENDIADMEHGRRLRRHVQSLVDAGLWHKVHNGWLVNDYLDYNPSHAELDEKREQARTRQAKWRKGRSGANSDDPSRRDDSVTGALVTRTSHPPDPTRPVPSPKEGSHLENKGGSKQRESKAAQPCGGTHDAEKPCRACAVARQSQDDERAKSVRQGKSLAAKAKAAQDAKDIAACDMCNDGGRAKGGRVCHHVESTGMPSTLRDSIKSKPAKEEA